MKKALPLAMALAALCACQKPEDLGSEFYSCEMGFADSSSIHPQHARYQAALDEIVQRGVVGINLAVFTPSDGMWLGASGMADLHNGIEMQPCHLSRMGSTVKMFTAATVLKLQEAGKLDLDDPIADYLQGPHIDKIAQAERATIRQLLQHSSGIYNYIQNLKFQTASINELLKEWEADELLKYAHRQKAYFEPGEDVAYSNTNYILLGLLIENWKENPCTRSSKSSCSFLPACPPLYLQGKTLCRMALCGAISTCTAISK
jgi:D-alanyl-D-alanine carboxypeptidase